MNDHSHHRSSDENLSRSLWALVGVWGVRAGSLTAIFLLLGSIVFFTNAKVVNPVIDNRSERVFDRKHAPIESRDSTKLCKLEQRQDEEARRAEIQFKVLYKLQCAKMSETELRRFRDDAISDTTIPREMIYP